jgi:hypothetical protein
MTAAAPQSGSTRLSGVLSSLGPEGLDGRIEATWMGPI